MVINVHLTVRVLHRECRRELGGGAIEVFFLIGRRQELGPHVDSGDDGFQLTWGIGGVDDAGAGRQNGAG